MAPTGTNFDNVVIVAMENHNYGDVIGNSCCPFINSLLPGGSTIPLYHSYGAAGRTVGGCSAGCYTALISGSDQGVVDGYSCCINASTLMDRMQAVGLTWQAYCERGCPRGNDHFPFTGFTSTHASTNIFTGSSVSPSDFIASANSPNPPNFLWFTPTDSHNMHDNSPATSDPYLRSFFVGTGTLANPDPGSLFASNLFKSGHRTLFILWWDEYDPSPNVYSGVFAGNNVVKAGYVSPNGNYDEFSTLRLIENNWGLPILTPAGDGVAAQLTDILGTSVPLTPDFRLTANPSSFSLQLGTSGSSSIGATAIAGFTGNIAVSVASPSGLLCNLSLTSIIPGSPSSLTCSSSTVGSYVVTINGVSGSLIHSTAVNVQVTSPPPPSGDFGSCTSLPTGWSCGNAIGLSGTHATMSNGVLSTAVLATGVGNDDLYQYATAQKGTFPWSPCQQPTTGVLPVGLANVSATFKVLSLPTTGRYHIDIALYYYLPNGPVTLGTAIHQCLDTQSRIENINGTFSPVGSTATYDPGDSFGWDIVTMGTVVAGGTYTLSADVLSNCQRDLAAWNIPTSTPCQLSGIEIGIEGFQFNLLDVSWSKVTLVTVIPPPPAPLTTGFSLSPPYPFPAQVVTFTASSSGGTPPYTQAWTFGDGSSGSGTNTTHIYSVVGTFNVTLRTTDTGAMVKTAVASHTVTIVAPPTLTASFLLSTPSPTVGQPVAFTATASGGTPAYSFSWAFGDESVRSGASTSHAYSSVGTFSVVLTVSDSGTPVQIVTVTHSITVSSLPPLTLSFEGFDLDGRNEVTLRLNGVIIAKYWPTTNLTNAQVWVPISETITLVAGINTIEFTHANGDCGINDNIRNLKITTGTRALFNNLADHLLNCTTPTTYSFTIAGMPPMSGLLVLTPVSITAGTHIRSI